MKNIADGFIAVVYLGLGMYILIKQQALTCYRCVRLGEKNYEKDSICQVDVINQQNVIATSRLRKEKVQKITSAFYQNLPIINR